MNEHTPAKKVNLNDDPRLGEISAIDLYSQRGSHYSVYVLRPDRRFVLGVDDFASAQIRADEMIEKAKFDHAEVWDNTLARPVYGIWSEGSSDGCYRKVKRTTDKLGVSLQEEIDRS